MILRQGDSGPHVEQLQLKLKAAGYDPGDIDGDFGSRTAAAVLAFQADCPDLEDDRVAGPMTLAALDAAVVKKKPDAKKAAPSAVACEAATWSAFEKLIGTVTGHPVHYEGAAPDTEDPVLYGPGRGLWEGGRFVITYAPGRRSRPGDEKTWPNVLGKRYPSFHCSSWTNFFVGWLLRRNEDYTHAGNIPSLFDLLEEDGSVHKIPGGGVYRGYGDACSPIAPDGSGIRRSGVPKVVDARELLARRSALPTFIVCGQSTKRNGTWRWWHHTVLFVVDHRDGDRLYRIAADGRKGPSGYSADPMRWVEITDKNVGNLDAAVYRAYGVNTTDGTYGDPTRPIADVDFET